MRHTADNSQKKDAPHYICNDVASSRLRLSQSGRLSFAGRYLPLPVHKLERKLRMRPSFITIFALLFARVVFAQSPFWQQTPLQTQSIIALAASKSGFIFAADYNGTGVYRSSDDGNTWTKVDSNLTYLWMRSLAIDSSGNIYAGSFGVYKSTNNGTTWTQPDTSLPRDDAEAIVVAPSGHIFVGSGGIFRSTNQGASWDSVNSGLTDRMVWSLATDASGDIFAGTDGGLFKSTDDGQSWSHLTGGFPSAPRVSTLLVSGKGWIYAGTDTSGLYRSTDDGSSWTRINAGLTDHSMRALAIASSGQLFAATNDSGVYTSKDDGDTWTQINGGLTNSSSWTSNDFVWCLTVSSDGYVFVGDYQSGVFRSIQTITNVRQTTNSAAELFQLRQNYPNPFNPSTVISYQLASPNYVTLKVYDVLGREVSILVAGRQSAGSHSVTFNAAMLPSGVYFYRLQAGAYAETKKLTLLR